MTPTSLTVKGRAAGLTPNEAARTVTGRAYITHSQVACFQRCSLAWHFQYVEHAEPESLSAAMIHGSAAHTAIEHHLHCLLAGDTAPAVDELMEVYHEAWEREVAGRPVKFAGGDTARALGAMARSMVEAFLASPHAVPNGEILGIEETLSVSFDPELPDLVGRVDVLSRTDDELVITDLKTARTMWTPRTAEEHGQQLILYGQAAEPIARELGLKVRLQFLVVTKAKSPKVEALPGKLNQDGMLRTRMILRRVFWGHAGRPYLPVALTAQLPGLRYRRRCEKWHRSHGSEQI